MTPNEWTVGKVPPFTGRTDDFPCATATPPDPNAVELLSILNESLSHLHDLSLNMEERFRVLTVSTDAPPPPKVPFTGKSDLAKMVIEDIIQVAGITARIEALLRRIDL